MTNIPDFREFTDWLIDGPAGEWPDPFGDKKQLTQIQKEIVQRNGKLLLDRSEWQGKIERFESALQSANDMHGGRGDEHRRGHAIRFDQHHFEANNNQYDFQDYTFPCAVSFKDTTFGKGNLSFLGARFDNGGISFRNAKFGTGNKIFARIQFGSSDVSFEDVSFGNGNVSFAQTHLGYMKTTFVNANFGKGSISFDHSVKHSGELSFENVTFGEGDVSLRNIDINKSDTSFSGALFGSGWITFYGAKIKSSDISFADVDFGDGDLVFSYADFGNGAVSFARAKTGKGTMSFTNANFEGTSVWMRFGRLCATSVTFWGMNVEGNLFIEAHFPKSVDFGRLTIKGTAQFSDCRFSEIPDFRDSKLDRPPEVARMVVPMPKLNSHCDFFGVCPDPTSVGKLRKLKAMALSANDHEKDGEFFAYEMMAKRGVETRGFWALLFNTFYGRVSFYGQSFSRPLVRLTWIWLCFTYSYLLLLHPKLSFLSNPFFAAELSARNTVPLLNSLFRSALSPDNGYEDRFQKVMNQLPTHGVDVNWIVNLGVAQQFVSAVLLFFLFLGLRNTFRLK
ncbi:MAG: hypothetical protein QM488_04325 [Rhizobiaceae bacterium]